MAACNAGFSDCDYNPANGCETAGACVYASCNAIPRVAPTGVYTLSADGKQMIVTVKPSQPVMKIEDAKIKRVYYRQ